MFTARIRTALCVALVVAVAGCGGSGGSADNGDVGVSMQASVWVDPDGCKHWVIDDGAEGYMSPVLNADGTPDCN